MSLAARLAIAVGLVLAAVTVAALAVSDRILVQQAEEPLQRLAAARLAWIRAGIEPGKGEIEWRDEDQDMAPAWSLATSGGRVLRQAGAIPAEAVVERMPVVLGDPTGPAAGDEALLLHKGEFRLADRAQRIELVATAAVDAGPARQLLARRRWLLWCLGPALSAALLALLAAVIRWQVRPLQRMVGRIAAIGPDDPGSRLGEIGGAAECRRLATAVDAMLARISEARERERAFSAAAAHELRTPLAQLGLALEVAARRERGPEETRRLIADLHADVERLQRLALGLLQLAGGGSLAVAAVLLAPLLARLDPAVVEPVSPGLEALADAALLEVTLANLVGNARRYAPGPPPVIAVARSGACIVIRVTDDGPGIADPDRERIFAPLVRLDAARSIGGQADGLGLGLAIARAVARRMGGDLVCRARPDGRSGACFELSLRAAPVPSQ